MGRAKKQLSLVREISVESFKQSYEYFAMKQQYPESELLNYEDTNATKIQAFYDYVLTSLAVQVAVPGEGLMNKFICLFPVCSMAVGEWRRKTFVNKQTYMRHLREQHASDLPDHGKFLFPSCSILRCDLCGIPFMRKEHFNTHLKSGLHNRTVLAEQEKTQLDKWVITSVEKILLCLKGKNDASIMWYTSWHDDQLKCEKKHIQREPESVTKSEIGPYDKFTDDIEEIDAEEIDAETALRLLEEYEYVERETSTVIGHQQIDSHVTVNSDDEDMLVALSNVEANLNKADNVAVAFSHTQALVRKSTDSDDELLVALASVETKFNLAVPLCTSSPKVEKKLIKKISSMTLKEQSVSKRKLSMVSNSQNNSNDVDKKKNKFSDDTDYDSDMDYIGGII